MESSSDPEKRVVQVVSIYVALVGGICLLGVLFAGEIVHILMPPSYYGSVPYVAPVLVGYLMLGFYFFAAMPIFYHKKTVLLPFLTGTAAGINVLLNIWLVPRYGAIASAWVTAATYGLFFLLVFPVGRRYQRVGYPLGRYSIPVSIILLSTLAVTQLGICDLWSLAAKAGLLIFYSTTAFLLLIRPYVEDRWWRKVLVQV
jgi:O-antigen/teichoic acid export membrane protein